MRIGITNSLRQFLHWSQLPPASDYDPLYCWDARRVTIDGRVMLVLCNASNRFCCVTAMRGAYWHHLESHCYRLIRESMLAMGFTANAVSAYLYHHEYGSFEKTHGRKALGCMNQAIATLSFFECDHEQLFQEQLVTIANNEMCHCATRKEYGTAVEWMAEDLRSHGIDPYGMQANDANRSEDQPVRPASTCVECGTEAHVIIGGVPYCSDCHNKKVEADLGITHVTNDNSVLACFDQSGSVVQFAVERLALPSVARWTARQILDDEEEREGNKHPGIEVRMYADPAEEQQTTLNALWDRVQKVLSHPSIEVEHMPPDIWYTNGVHRGNDVLFAHERGWGRIEEADDGTGTCSIVIDGQRYTADEFLRLFGTFNDFELHWLIRDCGEVYSEG